MTFSDIIGFLGAGCILLGFLLIQINKISYKSLTYNFLNLFGSIFILYSLYYKPNIAAATLNTAWVFISLIGIVKFIINSRKKVD